MGQQDSKVDMCYAAIQLQGLTDFPSIYHFAGAGPKYLNLRQLCL